MTLVIELPTDLEQQLVREAASAGLDPSELAVQALRRGLAPLADPTGGTKSETDLLLKVNEGLPSETWARYRALVQKRRDEALTPDEHAELISLSNQVEAANVRRIEALAELAGLRGTTLPALMDSLGIRQPPYE